MGLRGVLGGGAVQVGTGMRRALSESRTIPGMAAYDSLSPELRSCVVEDARHSFTRNAVPPTEGDRDLVRMALLRKGCFRSVFYYRCSHCGNQKALRLARASAMILPPDQGIIIVCDEEIGPGLRFSHAPAGLGARRVGANVSVGFGALVGTSHGERPIIEDNVSICANAVVIGGVTVGAGAIVGAGAVVVHDVPPNTTVVGNPAHVLSKTRVESSDEVSSQ